MQIILNNSSMVPVYEQLTGQIKHAIIDGALAEGEVLPSVRNLSAELRISALTVKKAYDKLEVPPPTASWPSKPEGRLSRRILRPRLHEQKRSALRSARSARSSTFFSRNPDPRHRTQGGTLL